MPSKEKKMAKIEPIASDILQYGEYRIDLNTAPFNVMLKLIKAIRDEFAPDKNWLNLNHTLQLLRDFKIQDETEESIEHLRRLLMVFVQQWWMLKPAQIPPQLKNIEEKVRQDAQVKPTVKQYPTDPDTLLVINSDGTMEISATLGKLRKALNQCLQNGKTAQQCQELGANAMTT